MRVLVLFLLVGLGTCKSAMIGPGDESSDSSSDSSSSSGSSTSDDGSSSSWSSWSSSSDGSSSTSDSNSKSSSNDSIETGASAGCQHDGKAVEIGHFNPSTDKACECMSNGKVACEMYTGNQVHCDYKGVRVEHSQNITVGCEHCTCSNTELTCSISNVEGCGDSGCRLDNGTAVRDGEMVSSGCNTCRCSGQDLVCTEHECATAASSTCQGEEGEIVESGELVTYDCRQCLCNEGDLNCYPKPCSYSTLDNNPGDSEGDTYQEVTYNTETVYKTCVSSTGSELSSGVSFREDCNLCICFNGEAQCTSRECNSSCIDSAGEWYEHDLVFAADCNVCKCFHGKITCTKRACMSSTSCTTDSGQVYSSGKTWKKGCSTCVCNEGVKMCSECSKTSTCTTDQGRTVPNGQAWQMDCNSCWCDSGVAVCTKKYCMSVSSRSANQISSDRDCTLEDGRVVKAGGHIKVDCNMCKCSGGSLMCTKKYCITGRRDCMLEDGTTMTHGERIALECRKCSCQDGRAKCQSTYCPLEAQSSCVRSNGEIVSEGSSFYEDDCQSCTCKQGTIECRMHDCDSQSSQTVTTNTKSCFHMGRVVADGISVEGCQCSEGVIVCKGCEVPGYGTVESGNFYKSCQCEQGKMSCISDCVTDSGAIIPNGGSDAGCVCLNGRLGCPASISKESCGELEGRSVYKGEEVTKSDGSVCSCVGSWIECKTPKLCSYNGVLVDQGSIAGSSCICLYTGSVVCNNKGTGSDDDDAVMMDSSSSDDSAPMMGTTGGEEFQIKGLVEVDPVFIATRTTEEAPVYCGVLADGQTILEGAVLDRSDGVQCMCTGMVVSCQKEAQREVYTEQDVVELNDCGKLFDGRAVRPGYPVTKNDGSVCTCAEHGTWFTCTSRDITCFYNGYSYAVGVVDELCDCLYTGDVVCRATDYLNEQGSDSYGQQANQSYDANQENMGNTVTDSEYDFDRQGAVCVYEGVSYSVGAINERCYCLQSGKVQCEDYLGPWQEQGEVIVVPITEDELGGLCSDKDNGCYAWAKSGFCDPAKDNGYMKENCKRSCNMCSNYGPGCEYKGRTYFVGVIDQYCICDRGGKVACESAVKPIMCYNNGKTYSIGAVNDYCTCNSNGRITCKAEVSVTEEVTGCEYNGRAYPNGAIDQYCTCVNGTVACERQIDNTGQEQIKQRMGCIVNGVRFSSGEDIDSSCRCTDGEVECGGACMYKGNLVNNGAGVQERIYTCLCTSGKMSCSLSRSCTYQGNTLDEGQTTLIREQRCVCTGEQLFCYPKGTCVSSGQVITDGQSVTMQGAVCSCTSGTLSCNSELCVLSDGTTILHGQSGVSNGEQCTCNKGVCNGGSQSCNVTVRATSDSLTRTLAHDTVTVVAGLGSCACYNGELSCDKGCFVGSVRMDEGEQVVRESDEICYCKDDEWQCKESNKCSLLTGETLRAGASTGSCRCGVSSISCMGINGWVTQPSCLLNSGDVIQEGALMMRQCGFCKCVAGVVGCYKVGC